MRGLPFFMIVGFALFLFQPSSANASDFCDGFKDGYAYGHKQASGRTHSPPSCPRQGRVRELGYAQGYDVGVQTGLAHGSKRGSSGSAGFFTDNIDKFLAGPKVDDALNSIYGD